MQLNTHLKLDNNINGEVIELKEGFSKIQLITKEFMTADAQGLVHGGFAFCAADFAAMAAVNDPNVVLVKSEVKFLAPVKVGETILFEAQIIQQEKNRSTVEVIGKVSDLNIFKGIFYTATLDKHILKK